MGRDPLIKAARKRGGGADTLKLHRWLSEFVGEDASPVGHDRSSGYSLTPPSAAGRQGETGRSETSPVSPTGRGGGDRAVSGSGQGSDQGGDSRGSDCCPPGDEATAHDAARLHLVEPERPPGDSKSKPPSRGPTKPQLAAELIRQLLPADGKEHPATPVRKQLADRKLASDASLAGAKLVLLKQGLYFDMRGRIPGMQSGDRTLWSRRPSKAPPRCRSNRASPTRARQRVRSRRNLNVGTEAERESPVGGFGDWSRG